MVTVIDGPPAAAIAVLGGRRVLRHAVLFSGARSHDDDPDHLVSVALRRRLRWEGERTFHTYRRAGIYRVTLTVRDSFGETASITTMVRVTRAKSGDKPHGPNRRPRPKS